MRALARVTSKDTAIKCEMQSVLLECPWSTCLIVDNCALIHCAALHYSSFSRRSEPVIAEDKHKQFTQFALQLPQSGNSLIVMLLCGLRPGLCEEGLRGALTAGVQHIKADMVK